MIGVRLRPQLLAALTLAFVLSMLLPAADVTAQQRAICFPGVPGIQDCIDPALAAYWQRNGGLPVFGYPLGPLQQITPPGATAALSAQWTERNRLELHPANRAPYNVLIGRVGAERLEQLGRDHWADGGEAGPQPGCLWFPETRHNVCDQERGVGFKSYWERNGLRIAGLSRYQQSLALFGLPLTTANPEPGPDGSLIITQWFERARFEWHPENPARSRVLLGLLGGELRAGGAVGAEPPAADPRGGRSIFGVEPNRGSVGRVVERMRELNPGWVRYNGVLWESVEASPGQRNWASLSAVEAELATIAETGAATMLVVRGAPGWAQAVPGKACGPIRPDALDEFAAFMGELVQRYSKSPYNVKYWELGNEPDAPVDLLAGNEPYGCWGDPRQPDYNGAAYAAMLKAVYPAIKAADPEAQVVFGGLLLDCDPSRLFQGRPCNSGNFLEGVLRAGGGDFFDILAYHSYVYWLPERKDWDLTSPAWAHRGGALLGKRAFIQEVMGRYGYNKPMIMNEGGLLCYRFDPICGPNGFYTDQANHAVRMYVRSWAAGLEGALWYTFNGPGWQDGGMLDRSQQPRPAYTATLFLSRLLSGAGFERATVEGDLEIYQFRKGATLYQVLWTNDGSEREVQAPAGLSALYTMTGAPLPVGDLIRAGFEPVVTVSAAP